MFEIKDAYKLELQLSEIMKVFGKTKKLTVQTKNWEKVPSLKVVEVVLVLENQYQQKSEVLYTFAPSKY